MAEHHVDPSDEIPEADLLEQQAPLELNEPADEPAGLSPDSPAHLADEADWLEQRAVLLDHDEDDYPHE